MKRLSFYLTVYYLGSHHRMQTPTFFNLGSNCLVVINCDWGEDIHKFVSFLLDPWHQVSLERWLFSANTQYHDCSFLVSPECLPPLQAIIIISRTNRPAVLEWLNILSCSGTSQGHFHCLLPNISQLFLGLRGYLPAEVVSSRRNQI